MKRNEENFDDLLDRHLGLFKASSRQQPDAVRESILSRLQSQPVLMPVEDAELTNAPRSRRPYFLAAAALVASAVLLVVGLRNTAVDAYAAVEAVDGSLSRTSGNKTEIVQVGERVEAGEILRTNDGSGGFVLYGNRVEMRTMSELAWEPADDGVRIPLNSGAVIVNAVQGSKRLYVRTKDLTVMGAGSVFLVVGEEAGSRVAVIHGEVEARQGMSARKLSAGEQFVTNPLMEPHSVSEQFSWSRSAAEHLALLQQSIPAQQSIAPKKKEFEVAAFKEVPVDLSNVRPAYIGCKGVDGVWSPDREGLQIPGNNQGLPEVPQGRCIGSALTRIYVAVAFDIPGTRISGDADALWLYQLEAKADDPSTATKEELHQMLQAFLIDRFKLKAHRYTEESQGYLLSVAKSGVKFKATAGDEEWLRMRLTGPLLVPAAGQLQPRVIEGKFGMKMLAKFLSGPVNDGKPVIDRTGLTGVYDISLELNYVIAVPGPRGGGNAVAPERFDPPLARALEDQLGLHLESAGKVPVEYLAVDHIEKPSEN